MSEQPQGPGWWLASDGRYYPPQAAGTPAQPWDGGAGPVGQSARPEPARPRARWWVWLLVVLGLVLVLLVALASGPFLRGVQEGFTSGLSSQADADPVD